MSSWFKYLIIFFMFILATVLVISISTRHSTNITATQEVQVAIESSELGTVRERATNALDKEALVANLILEIVETHKEQGNDINIDYVFLDRNGNKTEIETSIDSVQFRVELLGKKGEVVSTSTQRVSLRKD